MHLRPRVLHLRQCGVCFPHRRFAEAHDSQALDSCSAGMTGYSDENWPCLRGEPNQFLQFYLVSCPPSTIR